jgi:hypothetical protein
MTSSPHRKRVWAALVLLALDPAVQACGSDDRPPADTTADSGAIGDAPTNSSTQPPGDSSSGSSGSDGEAGGTDASADGSSHDASTDAVIDVFFEASSPSEYDAHPDGPLIFPDGSNVIPDGG